MNNIHANDLIRYAVSPLVKQEGDGFIRDYCFPADYPLFAGHFPGYPILPGMIQIMLGTALVKEALAERLELARIGRAKFQRTIHPGDLVRVMCVFLDGKSVATTLTVNNKTASAFKLFFV
jgi:3-hydroxyacyl-[acyl-carrier-protein] dehydratase